MKLLLIRHGQTPGNVLGQLDTAHPGPGLTELGQRQAEAMARSLANEPISALYASTLVRTQITAAPLGKMHSLDIEVLDGLHEIEAGSLEKLTDHESVMRYLGTVFAWAGGDLDRRMPAGGDGHQFFDRYDAAIARVAERALRAGNNSAAAVVSHGAAIRMWTASLLPATSWPTPASLPWKATRTRAGPSSTGTAARWAAWPWPTRRPMTPPGGPSSPHWTARHLQAMMKGSRGGRNSGSPSRGGGAVAWHGHRRALPRFRRNRTRISLPPTMRT